jgi:hypothetical protein
VKETSRFDNHLLFFLTMHIRKKILCNKFKELLYVEKKKTTF